MSIRITYYAVIVTIIWGVSAENYEKIHDTFKSNMTRNDFSNLLKSLIKLNEQRFSVLQKLSKLEDYSVLTDMMLRTREEHAESEKLDNMYLILLTKKRRDSSRRTLPVFDTGPLLEVIKPTKKVSTSPTIQSGGAQTLKKIRTSHKNIMPEKLLMPDTEISKIPDNVAPKMSAKYNKPPRQENSNSPKLELNTNKELYLKLKKLLKKIDGSQSHTYTSTPNTPYTSTSVNHNDDEVNSLSNKLNIRTNTLREHTKSSAKHFVPSQGRFEVVSTEENKNEHFYESKEFLDNNNRNYDFPFSSEENKHVDQIDISSENSRNFKLIDLLFSDELKDSSKYSFEENMTSLISKKPPKKNVLRDSSDDYHVIKNPIKITLIDSDENSQSDKPPQMNIYSTTDKNYDPKTTKHVKDTPPRKPKYPQIINYSEENILEKGPLRMDEKYSQQNNDIDRLDVKVENFNVQESHPAIDKLINKNNTGTNDINSNINKTTAADRDSKQNELEKINPIRNNQDTDYLAELFGNSNDNNGTIDLKINTKGTTNENIENNKQIKTDNLNIIDSNKQFDIFSQIAKYSSSSTDNPIIKKDESNNINLMSDKIPQYIKDIVNNKNSNVTIALSENDLNIYNPTTVKYTTNTNFQINPLFNKMKMVDSIKGYPILGKESPGKENPGETYADEYEIPGITIGDYGPAVVNDAQNIVPVSPVSPAVNKGQQKIELKASAKGFQTKSARASSRKTFAKCISRKSYKLCNKACKDAYQNVCRRLRCTARSKRSLKKECKRSCKDYFRPSSKYSEGEDEEEEDY